MIIWMAAPFFTMVLGFILGIKHAFEADHVLAVSTIVTEQKNPLKSALLGTFWGLGHTTTLFIVGIIVLLLKLSIPERLSLSFEFLVGLMLIFLGFRVLRNQKLIHTHQHQHQHDELTHQHLHVHEQTQTHRKHHTSYLIGTIHGLAGSGALMLLVLSTVPSLTVGLYYILLFGLGSTLGMTAMSFLVGLPFLFSFKFPGIEKYLRIFAGVLSILFGIFIIFQIASAIVGFK